MTRHILIVEDDRDIRETLFELLANEGYRVSTAENGALALQLLRSLDALPDVILLDLMMPVMDGHQFRSAQRADAALARIPVVVMSADPQMASYASSLDAHLYIRKPFDIGAILEATAPHAGGAT